MLESTWRCANKIVDVNSVDDKRIAKMHQLGMLGAETSNLVFGTTPPERTKTLKRRKRSYKLSRKQRCFRESVRWIRRLKRKCFVTSEIEEMVANLNSVINPYPDVRHEPMASFTMDQLYRVEELGLDLVYRKEKAYYGEHGIKPASI